MSDEPKAGKIDGMPCAKMSSIMGHSMDGISSILSVGACGGSEPELYPIDSTAKLSNITVAEWASGGGSSWDPGIYRTSSGGNWSCGATTVAEITSGDFAYIEATPSQNLNGQNAHWFIGLGYKNTPPVTSTNAYAWMQWGLYCWAGTSAAAFESGTLVNGTVGGGPNFVANRSWRVEVNSNTVTIKYSDDSWASSTTNYTFSTAVDIGTNGNLQAGFALYWAAVHPIENPKIYGRLTNT